MADNFKKRRQGRDTIDIFKYLKCCYVKKTNRFVLCYSLVRINRKNYREADSRFDIEWAFHWFELYRLFVASLNVHGGLTASLSPSIHSSISIALSLELCNAFPLWMGHSISPLCLDLAVWLCFANGILVNLMQMEILKSAQLFLSTTIIMKRSCPDLSLRLSKVI